MGKKTLSKIIVATMLGTVMALDFSSISSIAAKTLEATVTNEWEQLESDPDLRFAVISDTHVGPTKLNENKRLEGLFSTLYELDPDIDAISVVGDLTDNGTQAQYDVFQNIIENNKKEETELIISMGNHEGDTEERFTDATGKKPRENIEINGYHFITLSARSSDTVYGGNRYYLDEEWLKEQLDEAVAEDPTKPIFLFMHHGIKDTAYGTEDWNTPDLAEILKNYPQVVHFSGHSHYPLNDPRSIYQNDFTAINTSTLSYFELESGMMYGTIPPNANNAAQAMVLDVNDTEVRIRKLDLISGQYIGEDWVFNTNSGKEGFVYTDSRAEASETPYFEEDSTIKINDIKDNSCTITIDQAKVNDTLGDNNDEIVHSYKFDFINKKTGKIDKTHKIWSEYYFLPMEDTLTQTFTGLKVGTEYDVVVTALNAFKKTSTNTISTSFTTTGAFVPPTDEELNIPIDPAEVLLVDFDDNTANDKSASSNTVKTSGSPKIQYDEELNKNVAVFDGSSAFMYPFSDENYSKIKENVTLESVFKIQPFDSSYVDVVANMESAGLGFEVARISGDTENAVLEFWVRVKSGLLGTGAYVKVSSNIKYNEYIHAMATYDGEVVKLYVNGQLEDCKDAKGEIYHPTGSAKVYCIGSDIGSSGSIQSPMIGNVSTAKLYSRTLTDTDAYKAHYQELVNNSTDKKLVYLNNIDNVDGKSGTEIKLPLTVSDLPKNGEVRSAEIVVDIPEDLEVKSVKLNKTHINAENFDYNTEEGKLRIVLTNVDGSSLLLDTTTGDKTVGVLTLALKEGKNTGDYTSVKVSDLTFRCNNNLDVKYNVTNATSNITFVNTTEGAEVFARELYTSVGGDVIPKGYKAYAIEFVGIESDKLIKGNNNLEIYYNDDFTKKNGKLTYVTLVKSDMTVEDLSNINIYTITNEEIENSNKVSFGDINSDGIDAQDALATVSTWLRKTKADNKDILSINVSGDGLINTRDSIEIVDNFVSAFEFTILSK